MSDSMKTAVQPETEPLPLKLDVAVRPIAPQGNLVGNASVIVNDSFAVEGLKICSGEKGLYVNMPAVQGKDGRWRDTFKPITKEARNQLNMAILDAYDQAIERMADTLQATKKAAVRPSVTGTLKENTRQAKSVPSRPAAEHSKEAR